MNMSRRVIAPRDLALSARIVNASPLHYDAGADPSVDRPAHVRAASGLAWVGDRLVVVQDDANFIALVDPRDASVTPIELPPGPGGSRQFDDTRGNKPHKLDLEAVVSVPESEGGESVLVFGSGATTRRESVVVLRWLQDGGAPTVTVLALPAFYARLRAMKQFAGSELNVEAAVYVRHPNTGRLRLFNRGNGAARGDLDAVNATCDVSWPALAAYLAQPNAGEPPALQDVVQYDLGAVGGLPLTFTDAAAAPASSGTTRSCVVYTAAAEASPDATRDGPVAGCALGVIADHPGGIEARWAPLLDDIGQPFSGKVEGIALRPDDPTRCFVVVDRDAPDVPSELCEVVLDGPWFAMRDERTGAGSRSEF
jgi:hypothetical protein